jgi:hypothetical protein
MRFSEQVGGSVEEVGHDQGHHSVDFQENEDDGVRYAPSKSRPQDAAGRRLILSFGCRFLLLASLFINVVYLAKSFNASYRALECANNVNATWTFNKTGEITSACAGHLPPSGSY